MKSGFEESRRSEIAAFISALDNDPAVSGSVLYRCMNVRGTLEYYHLAAAADEAAVKALQSRDWFTTYSDQTERAADGEVEVLPLDIIGETKIRLGPQ